MSPTEPKKRGRPSRGITETNLRLYAPKALMAAMREAAKGERISLAEAWRRAAREWIGFAGVLVLVAGVMFSSCNAPDVACKGPRPMSCECVTRCAFEADGGIELEGVVGKMATEFCLPRCWDRSR